MACGCIGTRAHSHRATTADTSTDRQPRARRVTRQRQRNCCAPLRYASFGVPLSMPSTRRNRATRKSAVASQARSSLASPATHVRCAAAAAAANTRPAAGEGRKIVNATWVGVTVVVVKTALAASRHQSPARARRNPRSSPSSQPCSVVVVLPTSRRLVACARRTSVPTTSTEPTTTTADDDAKTVCAPHLPCRDTNATVPKYAIVTFVATVLRRRHPPRPSLSRRCARELHVRSDDTDRTDDDHDG